MAARLVRSTAGHAPDRLEIYPESNSNLSKTQSFAAKLFHSLVLPACHSLSTIRSPLYGMVHRMTVWTERCAVVDVEGRTSVASRHDVMSGDDERLVQSAVSASEIVSFLHVSFPRKEATTITSRSFSEREGHPFKVTTIAPYPNPGSFVTDSRNSPRKSASTRCCSLGGVVLAKVANLRRGPRFEHSDLNMPHNKGNS